MFDPDFRSGAAVAGTIGVVQLYPDGSSFGSFPGFEIPDGAVGDELIVWFLSDDEWVGSVDPVLASVTFRDSGGSSLGALTVVKTHRMFDNDATFFVVAGVRPSGFERLDITFTESGPVSWAVGNFPPGTYADAGEQTYSGTNVGTFTPTGGPVVSASTTSPSNELVYAHAVSDGGSAFAGAWISWYEPDSPTLSSSGGLAQEHATGEIYTWTAFAVSPAWHVGYVGT